VPIVPSRTAAKLLTATSFFHVIEWTSDDLLVVGYISNRADLRSWDDLIAFWQERAGPFAPD